MIENVLELVKVTENFNDFENVLELVKVTENFNDSQSRLKKASCGPS